VALLQDLRARHHKHAQRHARPRDSLKAGLGLTPRSNRLSNGRAMLESQFFEVSIFLHPPGFSVTAQARKLVNEKNT
jgi:hypothetical protein